MYWDAVLEFRKNVKRNESEKNTFKGRDRRPTASGKKGCKAFHIDKISPLAQELCLFMLKLVNMRPTFYFQKIAKSSVVIGLISNFSTMPRTYWSKKVYDMRSITLFVFPWWVINYRKLPKSLRVNTSGNTTELTRGHSVSRGQTVTLDYGRMHHRCHSSQLGIITIYQ